MSTGGNGSAPWPASCLSFSDVRNGLLCRKRPFAIHRGVRARPGGAVSVVAVVAPGASQLGRAQKKGGCHSRPGRSDAKRGGWASSARLLVCGRGLPAAKTKRPGARLPLARGVPGHPRIVAVDLGDDFAGSPESLPLSRVLPGGVGHRFVSFRVDGAVCSHHEGTPATGRRGGSRSGARPKGRNQPTPGQPADVARHGGVYAVHV